MGLRPHLFDSAHTYQFVLEIETVGERESAPTRMDKIVGCINVAGSLAANYFGNALRKARLVETTLQLVDFVFGGITGFLDHRSNLTCNKDCRQVGVTESYVEVSRKSM